MLQRGEGGSFKIFLNILWNLVCYFWLSNRSFHPGWHGIDAFSNSLSRIWTTKDILTFNSSIQKKFSFKNEIAEKYKTLASTIYKVFAYFQLTNCHIPFPRRQKVVPLFRLAKPWWCFKIWSKAFERYFLRGKFISFFHIILQKVG